jgi:alkylated DNA nucleotide flippase Atl1
VVGCDERASGAVAGGARAVGQAMTVEQGQTPCHRVVPEIVPWVQMRH